VRTPEPSGTAPHISAALADRLLAARRVISSLNVESDVRMRLHLRLTAICTALKVPGASQARVASRLERLIADAMRAEGRNNAAPG